MPVSAKTKGDYSNMDVIVCYAPQLIAYKFCLFH